MSKSFLETLTLGEIATIEDKIGRPISDAENGSQAKFLMALVVAKKKREGEKFTDVKAAELSMEEVVEYLGMGGGDEDE